MWRLPGNASKSGSLVVASPPGALARPATPPPAPPPRRRRGLCLCLRLPIAVTVRRLPIIPTVTEFASSLSSSPSPHVRRRLLAPVNLESARST
jgi:hypothetical protein